MNINIIASMPIDLLFALLLNNPIKNNIKIISVINITIFFRYIIPLANMKQTNDIGNKLIINIKITITSNLK